MEILGSSCGGRNWLAGLAAVVCVMTFTLATQVSAQVVGIGPVGRGPDDTEPVDTKPAKPPSDVKPWTLRFGVTEMFENNVAQVTDGGNDIATHFEVGLGRAATLGRATMTFNGDGRQIVYRQATQLNQWLYAAGATTSYPVTRRLTWDVDGTLTSNYAQDTSLLNEAGLVFPKVLTRTSVGSTGLSYALSPRTQLRASVNALSVSFASSELGGGSSIGTRISVLRQLSRSQSAGISWGQTLLSGISGDIQGLLGFWQAKIGRDTTLNVSGGIRPYRLAGRSGYQFAPGGSVGIATPFTRNTTLMVKYEETVEQGYGIRGTHLINRLNASSITTVSPRMTLEGGASYGLNSYPLDPDFRLTGTTADGRMRYQIVDHLTVSGQYSAWLSHVSSTPAVFSHRGGVSLSYDLSWR